MGLLYLYLYNQQMHNYIIKVYITTVSLCNLYSYMFRHFGVIIIRHFTSNALLKLRTLNVEHMYFNKTLFVDPLMITL